MQNKSKLIEYKNMYVVILPRETHVICMGSDGKWDDNYYDNNYNYYDYYYDYYDYNYYNYYYDYCNYNYYYTPLDKNPWP